jgi:hypothetical protein
LGTVAIIAISLSGLATVLVVGGFALTGRQHRAARRREGASRRPRAPSGAAPEEPVRPAGGDESAGSARDDTGEVRDDP